MYRRAGCNRGSVAIPAGTRLGHFETVSFIGAGGMGQVYRARDTKLGREVAIKILPEAVAQESARILRFEREAQLLASLNHPNVATLHGLEESAGLHFLVMELVPGETLAERLAAGALGMEDAIDVLRQIAEALEAAHEKGIVHRDLKPGNIKVTPDGKVKVLDFGLAKAFGVEAPGSDVSQSPTLVRDGTASGVILGTAAYMSPEQARGKALDKRTDIWSFGCVFYECLTGKQAFGGETVSDTLAAILGREPDWQALPERTPSRVRNLLVRCLQKNSLRRLRDIGDARLEIEDSITEASSTIPPRPAKRSRAVLVGFAGLVLWTIAVAFAVWSLTRSPAPERRPTRFVINPPADEVLGSEGDPAVTLTPDGKGLVYVAFDGLHSQLYLRLLDQIEATPIPGSEGASTAFFSPDGRWVGFYGDAKLKKLPLEGGVPTALCDAPIPVGASWGSDGTIVFTPGDFSGLFRVSADGGTPEVLTTPDPGKGESSHRWPDALPGGRAILFTIWTDGTFDNARIGLVSLETGETRVLLEGGSFARYAPSGHIVFARQGALLAGLYPFEERGTTSVQPPQRRSSSSAPRATVPR
jgi:serine/threonine-protein kinase